MEHSFGDWSILSQLIVTALVMGKSRARERLYERCQLRFASVEFLPPYGHGNASRLWLASTVRLGCMLLKVMRVGRPVFSIENLLFRSGAHVEL